MIIFICGGAKSGKSAIAEKWSKSLYKEGDLIYIATMNPVGGEDLKRIENHKRDREGTPFKAVEVLKDLEKIEFLKVEDTVLLDSCTSLLINEMFVEDKVIENPSLKVNEGLKAIKSKCKNLILVSDYIFSDGIVYEDFTRNYMKELGRVNKQAVELADIVVHVTYGAVEIYKGKRKLEDEGIV